MNKCNTVATRIGQMLKDLGARHCFGVIGTANFKVTHALATAGVGYIAARHEGNAAAMADAYAKATGELTLLSVHSGPGLTNALTGIGEAAKSRTPLLVLAGDTPVGGVTSNFHFDQAEMARSVGAIAERVHAPHTALTDVMRAVNRAMRDRQTVVLSLPIDIADAAIPGDVSSPKAPPSVEPVFPSVAAIERLAEDIVAAKRPVLLAGRGAVLSDAEATLIALGDRIGAVLATTVCGYGLFNESPWSVGVCGGFSSRSAVQMIGQSDLIIGFGATFTQWTTRKGKLIGSDTVVAQIDVDMTRLGSQRNIDHAIQSDAKAAAAALLEALDKREFTPASPWRSEQLRSEIELGRHHHETYEDCSTETFIDPRTVSKAIDRMLPADRLVASDAGHFMGWIPRYIRTPNARSACMSFSFQSVGLGMGSAIGLALSQPKKLTFLGSGDGGFFMSLSDLETAVRLDLRMCILVYNDNAYGAEVHHFRKQGLSIDLVQFPEANIAKIARGLGARAVEVRKLSDLAPLQKWVSNGAPGVFVVDAKICPELEADWHKEY